MSDSSANRLDPNKLLSEAFTLFGTSYYNTFIPPIAEYIKAARNVRVYKDRKKHLQIQLELMEAITNMDAIIAEGKQVAKTDQDAKGILEQRKRNRVLSLAYRQISDGIAWRSIGFSRFVLRVISQGRSPGAANGKTGRPREIQYATNLVDNGWFALLHDSTNILRVGDLSGLKQIPDQRPYLGEVKMGGKLITARAVDAKLDANRLTKKQEDRLWQAQIMISTRKWYTNSGVLDVSEVKPARKDFLPSVSSILKQAVAKGAYGRYVSSYMYVEAFDVSTIMTQFKKSKDTDKLTNLLGSMNPPTEELLMLHTSYDTIMTHLANETIRTAPPYTTYPFPAEIIAKIITGQMIFRTLVTKDAFKQALSRFGYELVFDESKLDVAASNNVADEVAFLSDRILFPSDGIEDESFMHIKHTETGFMYPFTMLFGSMMYEFLSVEYIVSVAEAVRATATPGKPQLFYPEISDSYRWF